MSPTQRTIKWYKDQGWIVGIVERYIPRVRRKFDLFGAFDLVAVSESGHVDFIQVSSDTGHAERKRKVLATEAAERLMKRSLGVNVVIFTWGKRRQHGHKGGRMIWKPRREVLS